jgi:ribosomal protein S12 methylthiotransferase
MRDIRFERLGVFTFSKEDGTKAGIMENQLTEEQKEYRREKAMTTQLEISQEIAASQVGKTLRVLVEKEANEEEINQADFSSWEHGLIRSESSENKIDLGGYLIARGEVDAPDIDGRVLINGNLPIGEFANVKIIGHTDYDLIAEPIK